MRKSTAILLFLVLALAATSIGLWRALAKERAVADSLQTQVVQRDLVPTVVAPGPSDIAPPEAQIVEKPNGDEPPLGMEDYGEFERRLLRDASYREARRRFRQLELTYGHLDLAKVMQISQETADRLIALLVERELRYAEKAHPNPRNEEEARIRRMKIEQSEQEEDAELAALLGQAKLAKWKEYQASLPARHQLRQLGAKLFAIGEPMREDQIEPLIAVIYAEQKRLKQELSEYTASLVWSGGMESKSLAYRNARQLELAEAANKRIHEKASSILSPPQLTILDDSLRRQFELEQAEYQMYRVQDDVSRVNTAIG